MAKKMETEMVKVSKIKLNPNNPRLIKDDNFAKLVQSVKDFPEMLEIRPIVVNKDMIVLGGNMRFRACIEAGLKEVPVIITNLSPEKQREFLIKDNVSGGDWDWNILANEWDTDKLEEWGLKLQGFETEPLEAQEDNFDTTPPAEAKTVLGDLYEIGEHRLLCGDSTLKEDVERLMAGEKADMVYCDPPYGVSVKNTQGEILGDNDLEVFIKSLPILKMYSKNDSHFYIWCASGDMFPPSIEAFTKNLPFQNLLPIRVIHENKRGKKGAFKLNFETCLFGNDNTKGFNSSNKFKVSETTLNDERYKGDGKLKVYPALWDEIRSTEHNMNLVHPTQKNVEMIAFYIEISSKKADIVLDLFLGSGSTMVAAHQLNRKCYGMELDCRYADVIVKRMLKLDKTLKIKRNGIDVTKEWGQQILTQT